MYLALRLVHAFFWGLSSTSSFSTTTSKARWDISFHHSRGKQVGIGFEEAGFGAALWEALVPSAKQACELALGFSPALRSRAVTWQDVLV